MLGASEAASGPRGKPASNAWQSGHDKIKHSRAGRWRALVLILVHVAMAIHIAIWYFGDRAVISPVEPSESIETFREGVINAGFVFFALAILSTIVLGRWFCGWGCHIVAIQDLCSWLMMKVGIKPKPFRSRLLMFFPLILAIYMFVWPALHREVIRPILMDARGRLPWWMGQSDPIPGVTTEFFVQDFWATFAPWYMAIPFILVCTFGAVYFLGSKGFCTYGCPYGGFFAPADKLAVGRIRVTDACEHCGHCTAVCTSNVRVHEEVRDFGMVVDPGCMKCMDCVSVCPNDALYFGLGKPSLLARPRGDEARATNQHARALRAARFDLQWYEEVGLFLVFLVLFWCFRGMLNQVPMLMAVGMGLVGAFCVWKLWCMRPVRLGGTPNIRLQSLQLRFRGRWTIAGCALVVLTLITVAAAGWSGVVKAHRWEADRLYATLETPLNTALRPDFQATPRELAVTRRAVELFSRSGPRSSGGMGWPLTPDEELNVAYMRVLMGDLVGAKAHMDRVIDTGNPTDSLIAQAAELVRAELPRDRPPSPEQIAAVESRVMALHERALAMHPRLDGARGFIIGQRLQALRPRIQDGRVPQDKANELRAMWADAIAERHPRVTALLGAARLELTLGDPGNPQAALNAAMALIDRAEQSIHGASVDDRLAVASFLAQMVTIPGQSAKQVRTGTERARRLVDQAAALGTRTGASALSAAGAMLGLGDQSAALTLVETGLKRAREAGPHNGQLRSLLTAANLNMSLGRVREAQQLFREAGELVQRSSNVQTGGQGGGAWELAGLGVQQWRIGLSGQDGAFLAEGVKWLEAALALEPESPVIMHDLAMAYYAVGRHADAERVMTAAANRAESNAYLARRLSGMLAELGKAQESVRWEQVAKQREQAAGPK